MTDILERTELEPEVRSRLVGRDDDLRRVRTQLADGALVVLGEAGTGKTALLTEIAEQLAADRTQILRASGIRFESDVAYSVLNQLLFALHDEFDQLGEAHRTALRTALGFDAGPAPSRILVSNAVLLLVRAVAEKRPLILIVDDLPWVDPASAGVLCFVGRRLAGSAARLLVSARDIEAGALPEYRLGPLTESAAEELLARRFPMLAPAVRRRVIAEAGGNPLALLELPDALERAMRSTTVTRRRYDTTLTAKEWEIADLAASGLTNKEIGKRLFLSHRTISSHLYQIFPKLGLTSRAGLRDALVNLAK